MMLLNRIATKVHKWRRGVLGLPFLVCSLVVNLQAQNNLSGQSGLMNVPIANMSPDGQFKIGYNYNPIRYSLRYNQKNSEQVMFFDLVLLPRLSINVNLLQVRTNAQYPRKEALGDRQIDVKYLLVKETPKMPAVAIIMSSPFTIDAAMLTEVIVATKHFELTKTYDLETTLGYGSPIFIWRDVSNLENYDIFSGFKVSNKSEYRYHNGYLTGLFAGVKLSYQKKIGLMAEWDSNRMNVGLYATIAKRFTLQAGLLKGDQVMFGAAYACPLFNTPKALR
jgi:hypothetical protein